MKDLSWIALPDNPTHYPAAASADQLIRSNLLGAKESAAFSIELERAGYSPSLATGGDAQLEERTRQMLKGIDLKAAAERAGL